MFSVIIAVSHYVQLSMQLRRCVPTPCFSMWLIHLFSYCYTGKGTFGIVLLAQAEGIVMDAPDRNIVAVKTQKGN